MSKTRQRAKKLINILKEYFILPPGKTYFKVHLLFFSSTEK